MPRTMRVAAAVPPEKTSPRTWLSKPAACLTEADVRQKPSKGAGDNILEAAESALMQKAVAMALGGNSTMMRYCLDQLSAWRMRTAEFMLPEITKMEDLSKATLGILEAAAAGVITFPEAKELSGLVAVHAEALRDGDLAIRVANLEAQQAQ
ncbi:hypothetical protein [Methylobacterium sp. Leaf117]|uniref:hypothetical protein n=1 Tax=Methylobacterium sp. Leaf117 TaxID=1736260 RepID=UPI0012E275A4|nr:hypothetical protein [Methylobacterium sp. Leaf117]